MTRRWPTRGLAVALLLVAAVAGGTDDPREQRSMLEQRLSTQRAALALLREQKLGVLEVLELVERLSRAASARARATEGQLQKLRKRIEQAERLETLTTAMLRTQVERLSPRLRARYRLRRQNPLDVLLSAEDFSGLIWRARALSRLVESDLEVLREIDRATRLQRRTVEELSTLRADLDERLLEAKEQALRASRQRRELADLVNLIHAEAVQSHRVIRELEQAERDLTRLVEELEQVPATTGFGALRGKLALPVAGSVEVGFGKVVNPRFNTVTVQKGLDLQAPMGEPVHAVGPGTVAYAGWLRGYGNLVILDHGDGFHTVVAHLAELTRKVGEAVQTGDVLGAVGDSGSLKGAYLYFELRQRGIALDPAPWIAKPTAAAPTP